MKNKCTKSVLLSFFLLSSLFFGLCQAQPRVLVVLPANFGANTHFNLDNLAESGYSLTLAGATRMVASCPWSASIGSQSFTVDTLLSEISSSDAWDAIAIMPAEWRNTANPNGDLLNSVPFMNLLKEANGKNKMIWATCSGIRVLAAADIIRGLRVTGQATYSQACINAGATFAGANIPPVWDRNIITSSRGMYYMQENIEILSTTLEKSGLIFNRDNGTSPVDDISLNDLDIAPWNHQYRSGATMGIRSVCRTPEGEFISAGYSWSVSGHNTDLLLIRSDASGKLVWSNTFGDTGWEYGWSVIPTQDGCFVAVGYSSSTPEKDKDMYILKIDSNGGLLWESRIGDNGQDVARDVTELTDGTLILAGYTDQTETGEYDVMVAAVNNSGEQLWTRKYGNTGPEIIRSVIQNRNGQIILAGETGSTSNGNRDMLLICLNASGSKVWEKTYHKDNYDSGYDVIESPGGGYNLIGHGDIHGSDFLEMAVVKTDSTGNCLSHEFYEASTRFYDYGKSLAISDNGTLAYVGAAKKKDTRENKLFLILIGPDGRTELNNWFNLEGSSWCTSVIADRDNHFVIAGQTASDDGLYRPWLLKIQNPTVSGISGNMKPDAQLLDCHPNPFTDQINIKFSREIGRPARISVVNLNGNVIAGWTVDNSMDTITWNGESTRGESVPSGYYLIKCTAPGYSGYQKVLYLH